MDFYDDHDDPQERPLRRPRRAARIDDDVAEGIQSRMAAKAVWRMCNQKDHVCSDRTRGADGRCTHRNHRRDIDYAMHMMDMLGLERPCVVYNEADRTTWLAWIGQSGPPDATLDNAA